MVDPDNNKQRLETAKQAVVAGREPFIRAERDPARIHGVVNKLREIWERNPDLRLAQLFVSAAGATEPCPEIFYLEDAELLRRLDKFEFQERRSES